MRLMNLSRRTVFLAVAGILFLQMGCAEEKPVKIAVVPVRGKVSYRGKPPVGAQVVLLPVFDNSPDAIKPRGRVKADGSFELTSYSNFDGKADGAPPGDYLVSIRWAVSNLAAGDDDDGGPTGGIQRDRLGDKYSNPKTSGLKVTVTAGKDLDPIELK